MRKVWILSNGGDDLQEKLQYSVIDRKNGVTRLGSFLVVRSGMRWYKYIASAQNNTAIRLPKFHWRVFTTFESIHVYTLLKFGRADALLKGRRLYLTSFKVKVYILNFSGITYSCSCGCSEGSSKSSMLHDSAHRVLEDVNFNGKARIEDASVGHLNLIGRLSSRYVFEYFAWQPLKLLRSTCY